MKLKSYLQVGCWYYKQIKSIKYAVEFNFSSKDNKLILISFVLDTQAKLRDYGLSSREYERCMYISKGYTYSVFSRPWDKDSLSSFFQKKTNWPKPYSNWTKLSDVVVPDEVWEYVRKKCLRQK